jgi:pyrimidine operon attenuation protein/uracil phosphoribosyltransferase
LLFNVAFEYDTWRVHANQEGFKLNITHQLLVYVDDVNMLGESVHTIRKNTEASKKIGREENAEKTMYMTMSRNQNAGQNNNM